MISKDGGVGEGHPLMTGKSRKDEKNRDQLIAADSIWSHPSPTPTAFYLEERMQGGAWREEKEVKTLRSLGYHLRLTPHNSAVF